MTLGGEKGLAGGLRGRGGGRELFFWLGTEDRRAQTLLEEGTWVLGLGGESPKSFSSAGKPRLGGEFVLGAIGGAGAAISLSLCSCLIFFR